jgi:hypothetical protein
VNRTATWWLVSLLALLLAGCTTVQVVYQDGCFHVRGIPPAVKAIRISLRSETERGIDKTDIYRPVGEDGTTTPICVTTVYQRRYGPGKIEITTYDADGKKTGTVTNTAEVSLEEAVATGEVGYDQFQ